VIHESGAVELYFYDELASAERAGIAAHLRQCGECAATLEDLGVIRSALADRPDVAAPAAGDWSGFMARLDAAVQRERAAHPPLAPGVTVFPARQAAASPRSWIGLLATAALLALVTISVIFVARQRPERLTADGGLQPRPLSDAVPAAGDGLRSAGEKHFERSKLVVLGLAERDAADVAPQDWAYERELASALLNDTRLYRMAAEEHGLKGLAGVLRDLELVLLETSMAEDSDPAALGQIQRLIQKRSLIQKMGTVASAGM
jgi:hypothetical protein